MSKAEEVRVALTKRISGISTGYFQIIKSLRTETDPSKVKELFLALGQNASLLSRNHVQLDQLISLLLLYDWTNGEEVSAAFVKVILGLVSSNAGFLEPVFQHLVSNFFPPHSPDPESDDEMEDDTQMLSEEMLKERSAQVHHALKSILQLIPLGCSTLLPVIFNKYPRNADSIVRQSEFLKQCLRVCDYVPIIRDRIMALAVERVLNMDTDIRMDDLSESKTDDIFSMEEEEVKPCRLMSEEVKHMADKVDACLDILCEYVDRQLDYGQRASKLIFELLMNIFDRMVLRTRNAKFTQFLMFYVCRKRSEFVDSFIERLLQRALSHEEPHVIRLAAINYLASFLARSLYIQVSSTHSALSHMMEWIHQYASQFEARYGSALLNGVISIDPQDHIPYFALCQATAYVLMFKGEDLEAEDLRQMNWDVIIDSHLKPYTYMSADVLEEFMKYARSKALLKSSLLDQLMGFRKGEERTRHVSMKTSITGKAHFTSARTYVMQILSLDYPFDPCLLKQTAKRVAPYYQQWLSVDGAEHEAEYQRCEASIDKSTGLDNEDGEHYIDNEALMEAQATLPPPIHLQGLSSRAALMLSQLGGNFQWKKLSGCPPHQTPPNFWAFAFDANVNTSSPIQSYVSEQGIFIQKARQNSIDELSDASQLTPRIRPVKASLEDEENMSGSW